MRRSRTELSITCLPSVLPSFSLGDVPEIDDRLLTTAQTLLELDRVNILLADRDEQWLQAVASIGTEDPLEAIRVPIGPEGGGDSAGLSREAGDLLGGSGPGARGDATEAPL